MSYNKSCEDYMQNVIDWMNDHIGKPSEYDSFEDYYSDVLDQDWANHFENVIEHCKDTLQELYSELGGKDTGAEKERDEYTPKPPEKPPREIIYHVYLQRVQKRNRHGHFMRGFNIYQIGESYRTLNGRFATYDPQNDLIIGAVEHLI